jgi:hypothetical protein
MESKMMQLDKNIHLHARATKAKPSGRVTCWSKRIHKVATLTDKLAREGR